MTKEKYLHQQIRDKYADLISAAYPEKRAFWPLVSSFGYKVRQGSFKDWAVIIYFHTGSPYIQGEGIGGLSEEVIGHDDITPQNKDDVRRNLEVNYGLQPKDVVFLYKLNSGDYADEMQKMLERHEIAMGVAKMRIFLSHKGANKNIVRTYKTALDTLGFQPWLDEDAMAAGTNLERGISRGFADSCAAVFFITPEFVDEDYLATEVDYAIREKRQKKDKFAIITLRFNFGGRQGDIPELLRPYVWKEPSDHLEGLVEVLNALPLKVGAVTWRR